MKLTGAMVRDDLNIGYQRDNGRYQITLKGVVIGHMVQYGKYVGWKRNRVRDVVGSRMNWPFRDMDLEASDRRSLLNKLAPKVAKTVRVAALALDEPLEYSETLIQAISVYKPKVPAASVV